jgi:transcription elongation factor Elf1
MTQKELEIPRTVRSYQEYPEIIEFEGCPRCKSLDVSPKLVSFKKFDVKFEVTCFKCGLLYHAAEKIDSDTQLKSIIITWDL